MKSNNLLAAMHAVLDGEATDAETRELELRLAADPSARAEFEGLKRLFRALESVPMEHPPEGLVAAVTAALPPTNPHNVRQLPTGSRVFGHALPKAADRRPNQVTDEQPPRSKGITIGSIDMTEQNTKSIGNRKAWFGVGIAAAAVLVVAQYGFDFPLGKDVTGAIVPAQRYRAEPNGSQDVKVGTPAAEAAKQGLPTAVATEAAALEKNAVERGAAQKDAAERGASQKNAIERGAAQNNDAERGAAQKNAVERNAAQNNAVERNAAQNNAVERNAAQNNAVERNAAQNNAVERNAAQNNAVERNAAQNNAVDRNAAQRNAVERSAVERNSTNRVAP